MQLILFSYAIVTDWMTVDCSKDFLIMFTQESAVVGYWEAPVNNKKQDGPKGVSRNCSLVKLSGCSSGHSVYGTVKKVFRTLKKKFFKSYIKSFNEFAKKFFKF